MAIVAQLRALANGCAADDPKSFPALVMRRAAMRLEALSLAELKDAKREGRGR
jgi:hypothetical protein